MSLTVKQKKDLETAPPPDAVKTRDENGQTLSYLEGWYVIREANRIFGPEHWDRITLTAQPVWQGKQDGRPACTYAARVRICVRARNATFVREGSGAGHATGAHPGEAHAQALKAAETDATKRALATLGAPFGLTLYDARPCERDVAQAGDMSRQEKNGAMISLPSSTPRATRPWILRGATGEAVAAFSSPILFCSSLRRAIEKTRAADELEQIYQHNRRFLARLVSEKPALRDRTDRHYSEILSIIFQTRLKELARSGPQEGPNEVAAHRPPLS